MDGGPGHRAAKLVRSRDVAHRHDRVGHRRADVGAHNDRDGILNTEGAGRHQAHHDRGRRRGRLDQARRQDAQNQAQKRTCSRSGEQPLKVEGPLTQPFDAVAHELEGEHK